LDAEGVEGVGNGEGVFTPQPTRESGGSVVTPPAGSGAEIEFYTVWMPKKPSGDTYCTEFSQLATTAITSKNYCYPNYMVKQFLAQTMGV